jgi:hypothetical protein
VDAADAVTPAGPLVSFWSVRGAPHVHPADRMDAVREALAPRETDEGGAAYVATVEELAAAFTAIVTGPTPKAAASTELTRRAGEHASWCEGCEARHVPETLFRAGGRAAGVVLETAGRRTVIHPRPRGRQQAWPERARSGDPRRALLDTYLRVNGPTGRTLYRDWSGLDAGATGELWAGLGPLVRVAVDGRRLDLPEDLLDDVTTAPDARGVALVPPHDPYLGQADRNLLVPDKARRQQVWRAISGPGALLVDGEVAGVWRYRRTARELTVTPFDVVTPARRKRAAEAARLVAAVDGDDEPRVIWT